MTILVSGDCRRCAGGWRFPLGQGQGLREIEPAAEQWLVSHQVVSTVIAEMPEPAPEMPDGPLSEN
ncbi:hypothetical protein [Promicromonospora sp. AC04]|uniref:hypothetical protein n=1 Tax=Promicromonospora sp. AC04 TaxID=2135723 RepID=UPI0011B24355|nr:hypothetical protein [Promicromonospora sp. AC04]